MKERDYLRHFPGKDLCLEIGCDVHAESRFGHVVTYLCYLNSLSGNVSCFFDKD